MIRARFVIITAVAASLAGGVLAAPAHADWTTFWPSLSQTECNALDVSGVEGGATQRRGNYGLNRRYTKIYVNGGYWHWGAIFESGSNTSSSHSQTGSWSGVHENAYWSTLANDPFIRNNNSSTIGASGCFQW